MHSSRMRTARSSSRQPGGSASVHAGIHPPGVGPEPPPGVGLETPWPDPQAPPGVWAWKPARHAGIPPARHAGMPHPPPL